MRFEWDEKKNIINKQKHGIAFDEAASVFYDDYARFKSDPDHSESEERFLILGISSRLRVLVISHCYRAGDEVARIISARQATTNEKQEYMEFLS